MDPDDTQGFTAADALRAIESRLERASDAAERLIAEAAETVASQVKPPPSGWSTPGSPDAGACGERSDELPLVVAMVQRLAELVPEELRRRLAEALRELLLAVRAMIDWYLERVEKRRSNPVEVQDIPIS